MTDTKTRIAAFDRATFELVHGEHGIDWRPHGFRGPIKYALLTCTRCDRSLVIVDDEGERLNMGKQALIPGTTHKAIAEIDHAAEAYVEIRDKRMKLTMKEVEAQAALVAAMQKHKLDAYRCTSTDNPLDVTMVSTTKAKVRSPKDEDGKDEE